MGSKTDKVTDAALVVDRRSKKPPSPPGGASTALAPPPDMIPISPLPPHSPPGILILLSAVVISYKSLFPMTPFSWEHAVDQAAKGLKALKEVQCSAP